MDSIIGTFHIDWKIMIAQAFNFGVVFLVLYWFALRPLTKIMRERTEKIEKGISDAKKSSELVQKASEEYEKNTLKLRQLSATAQKELEKDLEKLRVENLNRIKADNDEWTKKRIEQMEVDKKALVDGAKSEITSLAMLIVKKIMEDENKKQN